MVTKKFKSYKKNIKNHNIKKNRGKKYFKNKTKKV